MNINDLPRTRKSQFENAHLLWGKEKITPRNSIKHKFKNFDYESILDSVYEMVRDTAEGNGTFYFQEMPKVLKAEGWAVRIADQKTIINMLEKQK